MSKRKKLVEVVCPRCKKIHTTRYDYPKTCDNCRPEIERERRYNTKRRLAQRSTSCGICAEDARFEYFLKPPYGFMNRCVIDKFKRTWFTLCQRCLTHWLETGDHFKDLDGKVGHVSVQNHRKKPMTHPDLKDAHDQLHQPLHDPETGVFANERRKPVHMNGFVKA